MVHQVIKVYKKLGPEDPNPVLANGMTLREFQCRCIDPRCQVTLVSDEIVAVQNKFRPMLKDVPLHFDCGYRCAWHNYSKEIGGVPYSRHMTGHAQDVKVDWTLISPNEFGRLALLAGYEKALWYPIKEFYHCQVKMIE
jgi:hypothetical protein